MLDLKNNKSKPKIYIEDKTHISWKISRYPVQDQKFIYSIFCFCENFYPYPSILYLLYFYNEEKKGSKRDIYLKQTKNKAK